MISQSAEYSLRAVICLADQIGRPLTTQQIAATTKIPLGYLSKILQALGRARIVESQRGVHGGFVLIRRPEDLTLLQLIQIVDPSHRIEACPLGIPQHSGRFCPLHRQLDQAAEAAEQLLAGKTIADLLRENQGQRPLCNHETCERASKEK